MAHFYGNLKGSRSEATRCGTANSGIRVSARSWAGSVTVEFEETASGPWVRLSVSTGSAVGGRLLYSGRLATLNGAERLVPSPEFK